MNKLIYTLLLLISGLGLSAQTAGQGGAGFTLIELPYTTDALEPAISRETVELHHGKHLRGYVAKLNTLISGTKYASRSLVEIVRSSGGSLFDNAGQTLNHNLYFTQFIPRGKALGSGVLRQQIDKDFGSLEQLKQTFEQEGLNLFGSGWLWLSRKKDGRLIITKEANGGNPVTKGLTPLLGVDLWEHAYYLDYQNRRADHLKALWSIIDWSVVERRYLEANPQ